MRLTLASVLTGLGLAGLLIVCEIGYLTYSLAVRNAALGSSAFVSMMIHPRHVALVLAAFAVGVFIANRFAH